MGRTQTSTESRNWHGGYRRAERFSAGLRRAARIILPMFGLALCLAEDNPGQLLRQASQNILDTVDRLPRYVCTQTVERYRYEPEVRRGARTLSCDDVIGRKNDRDWKQQLTSSDRLRFDVAVNHGGVGADGEMYSWVGADRFGDRDLFQMVREGALSSGTFSSMLASIFRGNSARFTYEGDHTAGERLLSEFGFQVPQEKSSYQYLFGKGDSRKVTVPYGGTVEINPETSELVRLLVRTGALPTESGACELTREVDYHRSQLHGSDFLLPAEAKVSILHTDETIAENVIHYSNCREYQGDSTVQYEPPPENALTEPSRQGAAAALDLPPGLPFTVSFTDRIDPATAAAGDLVHAQLKAPIRDSSKRRILAPEGTAVTARIVSIQRVYDSGDGSHGSRKSTLLLAVKLESLGSGGKMSPLRAGVDKGSHRFSKMSDALSTRVELGSLDQIPDSDAALFKFQIIDAEGIGPGLESNWVTLGPGF